MATEKDATESGPGLAAAMAVGRDGARADTFLDEQTKLTRLQIEQIEEENITRRRILKLEHVSAAMKLAFELALAIIFSAIAVGLGAAVWSAVADNGLVVESFSVPPDLAGKGLTGDVVAAKLLDKLSSLQAQTVSSRAGTSYANNWGGDIKLQIPDTGVSIGEFNRSLHAWLGHQTRITGEVYRTPAGLSVTARAGNSTSPTFNGNDADLDKLIRQAAESVYRATQPYRYAVYLANSGRNKEAEAAYRELIANGSPTDRAWAHIGIENIYASRGDRKHALVALARALALKPDFIMVYINRSGVEGQFQHDEASLIAIKKAAEIARGPRDHDLSDIAWQLSLLQSESNAAGSIGNYSRQLELDRQIEALPNFNNAADNAHQNDITTNAFLHDAAASEAAFEALPPAASELGFLQHDGNHSFAHLVLGEPDLILALRVRFDASLAKFGAVGPIIEQRQFWPFVAYGLALRGDFKGAHATIDRTPVDCSQCLRIRGIIDMLEKNWDGAGYWFARATSDAPSVPLAWSEWGQTLLEKGDFDGAIAKFEIAHEMSPHFADPIEMWGEALARKGHADLAIGKFEEANRFTPRWGRLHLKWGDALLSSGDKAGAAKQFALAHTLSLTAAEKAELEKMKSLAG